MSKELRGSCGECSHVWTLAYLPMDLTKVADICKRAICPACACKKVFVANGAAVDG